MSDIIDHEIDVLERQEGEQLVHVKVTQCLLVSYTHQRKIHIANTAHFDLKNQRNVYTAFSCASEQIFLEDRMQLSGLICVMFPPSL